MRNHNLKCKNIVPKKTATRNGFVLFHSSQDVISKLRDPTDSIRKKNSQKLQDLSAIHFYFLQIPISISQRAIKAKNVLIFFCLEALTKNSTFFKTSWKPLKRLYSFFVFRRAHDLSHGLMVQKNTRTISMVLGHRVTLGYTQILNSFCHFHSFPIASWIEQQYTDALL